MKFQLVKGETSVILTVFILDSSSAVGAGLADLIHTSSIVGGYVKRGGTGVALAVDEDVTTEGTYEAPSTAAHVRIGTPANMTAGTYELHFHNDLFTTADWVTITLGGAANMAPLLIEIQLTGQNLNTAVPDVNVARLGGSESSQAYLKDFADTGYNYITHKVAGVVLVDTSTTNTDAAKAASYTAGRATKLDNLDATISSIATILTAIKGASWTVADTLYAIRALLLLVPTAGAGSVHFDPCITETGAVGGTPVADAQVWVTSDAAGATRVAGTLTTDSTGRCVAPGGAYGFNLDPGTYYLWAQKNGWNGIAGTSFTVS